MHPATEIKYQSNYLVTYKFVE